MWPTNAINKPLVNLWGVDAYAYDHLDKYMRGLIWQVSKLNDVPIGWFVSCSVDWHTRRLRGVAYKGLF